MYILCSQLGRALFGLYCWGIDSKQTYENLSYMINGHDEYMVENVTKIIRNIHWNHNDTIYFQQLWHNKWPEKSNIYVCWGLLVRQVEGGVNVCWLIDGVLPGIVAYPRCCGHLGGDFPRRRLYKHYKQILVSVHQINS